MYDHEHHRAIAAIGDAVRARRRRLGLRQHDLAVLAGCSVPWLVKLEAGRGTVQVDKVVDVLDALGLHLEIRTGAGPISVGDDVA